MAKKKNEDGMYAEIAKDSGGQVFEDIANIAYFIDTGNFAVNYICSGKFYHGGIPGGKITEAFGPESSGKSLWGYRLLSAIQKIGGIGVYLDCERAANPGFARNIGHMDTTKTFIYYPATFSQIENSVIAATQAIRKHKGKDVPILFVWDSIGVTMCEREWNDIQSKKVVKKPKKDEDGNEIVEEVKESKEQPGERAKRAGAVLRKLTPFLDENNATMYVVNQIRSKVGVVYGDPDTGAGGGRALPYYASLRLKLNAQKKMEDKVLKIPLGINLKITNKKNRSFKPFLSTEGVQLYFDQGINPLGGLLSALLGAKRVVPAGKGNYQVAEPFADGRVIKFKASKERNDVPLSLLLDCPALVDASSADNIKDYLGAYAEAIELSNSDDIAEIEVQDEGDDVSELVSQFATQ